MGSWFKADKSGPFVDWLLVLPNRIAGDKAKTASGRLVCENREKVPVILMLNFPGNHAVLDDVEVPPTEGGWFRADGDRSRIGASFGYVRRGGQHGISGYDWLWMLDFSDNAFAK